MPTINPPARLNEIAATLQEDNDYEADGAVTHCSEFLRDFAHAAFDYHGFDGKPANEIVDFMRAGNGWTRIYDGKHNPEVSAENFSAAQTRANEGHFVVIGLRNLGAEHGHVVVVVTGTVADSPKWEQAHLPKKVPIVAQAGANLSDGTSGVFPAKPLSVGISPASYAHGELVIYYC